RPMVRARILEDVGQGDEAERDQPLEDGPQGRTLIEEMDERRTRGQHAPELTDRSLQIGNHIEHAEADRGRDLARSKRQLFDRGALDSRVRRFLGKLDDAALCGLGVTDTLPQPAGEQVAELPVPCPNLNHWATTHWRI